MDVLGFTSIVKSAMGNSKIEKLDAVSFDNFIAQIDPFKNDVDVFDLSGVKFISPAALVQLSATC